MLYVLSRPATTRTASCFFPVDRRFVFEGGDHLADVRWPTVGVDRSSGEHVGAHRRGFATMVDLNIASWNQVGRWLGAIHALWLAA